MKLMKFNKLYLKMIMNKLKNIKMKVYYYYILKERENYY